MITPFSCRLGETFPTPAWLGPGGEIASVAGPRTRLAIRRRRTKRLPSVAPGVVTGADRAALWGVTLQRPRSVRSCSPAQTCCLLSGLPPFVFAFKIWPRLFALVSSLKRFIRRGNFLADKNAMEEVLLPFNEPPPPRSNNVRLFYLFFLPGLP